MQIFNDLTRKKEEFTTIEPGKVKMYACGPTVYNFFHIGNARCFVVFDMFRRYLEYRGYDVTFVQNFTDVDDKMIKKANEEGVTVADIADRYIAEYFTDAKGLGIHPADIHPRATENIGQIIGLVSKLVKSGHAYATGSGDVYFRTRSFAKYGCLSHMPIEDLESGARIAVGEIKEDPLDFALWKAAKPGEPAWQSPWGMGRPGWHIECSAMVGRYLGKTIDLHCGGVDLTFPHHENEIAQSEAANGCVFSNYWMHNGFINVDNQKMSKSLNNFFTVRDVAAVYGYPAIRFFLLSSHYRKPINYSTEVIEAAKNSIERIQNCADSLAFYLKDAPDGSEDLPAEVIGSLEAHRQNFIDRMDDDFNTADAVSELFEIVRELNSYLATSPTKQAAKKAGDIFLELGNLLGFIGETAADRELADKVEALIAERAEAKAAKNFARADEIRAELSTMGITLQDTKNGTRWKKN